MFSIRLDKDVCPLSAFRARCANYVTDVCATGRPLLLTLQGRSLAVVIDVREFEMMRMRLEALEAAAANDPSCDPGPAPELDLSRDRLRKRIEGSLG